MSVRVSKNGRFCSAIIDAVRCCWLNWSSVFLVSVRVDCIKKTLLSGLRWVETWVMKRSITRRPSVPPAQERPIQVVSSPGSEGR